MPTKNIFLLRIRMRIQDSGGPKTYGSYGSWNTAYRDLEVDESGEVCLVAQELNHHEFVAGLPGKRKQELEHNSQEA